MRHLPDLFMEPFYIRISTESKKQQSDTGNFGQLERALYDSKDSYQCLCICISYGSTICDSKR